MGGNDATRHTNTNTYTMNHHKAYAAGLKYSMSRPSTADMTIAASTIALGVAAAIEAAATRNGITADQMAAGMFLQSIAARLPAEAKAVLAKKTTAIPALDRVAVLRKGDDHDDQTARIIAAILA